MAVSAIINEGRLKRRLDPCYLCEIDIASKLPAVLGFKVKFLNFVSINHNNASFLCVGGVDKHFLSHEVHLHAKSPQTLLRATGFKTCLFRAMSDARSRGALAPSALELNSLARFIAFLLRHSAACASQSAHSLADTKARRSVWPISGPIHPAGERAWRGIRSR